MQKIYIGCSGFHYKEWKGIFYPEGVPQSKWFQFYCSQFNTLEINTSFYKFPTPKSLRKWFDSSPEEFRFSVKAPRLITHYKRFNDCSTYLQDFYAACDEGLGDKLGCILFQLHPQISYSEEILELLISCLNPRFKNVLEFRNESWWNKKVYAALKRNKIVFSGISYPGLPEDVVSLKEYIYYRFHGIPILYKSPYSEIYLNEKFSKVIGPKMTEVWIYFNNTWGTAAIVNARHMQQLVEKLKG